MYGQPNLVPQRQTQRSGGPHYSRQCVRIPEFSALKSEPGLIRISRIIGCGTSRRLWKGYTDISHKEHPEPGAFTLEPQDDPAATL